MVIGYIASGKSTLSKIIKEKMNHLELIHLNKVFFSNETPYTKEDTVIFLDTSRFRCITNYIKRVLLINLFGRKRTDTSVRFENKFKTIKRIWKFKQKRKSIMKV